MSETDGISMVEEISIPLFPLPDLVFFPGAKLPLHIFESRYREMVADALKGPRMIGMILLRPGWEGDYEGTPLVHEYGTLGVIEHAEQLADGRYNLILNGLMRFRVLEELPAVTYRMARVAPAVESNGTPEEHYADRAWLVELASHYLRHLPGNPEVPELVSAGLPELTNAISMAINIPSEERQELLAIGNIRDRARRVATILEQHIQVLDALASFPRTDDPSRN